MWKNNDIYELKNKEFKTSTHTYHMKEIAIIIKIFSFTGYIGSASLQFAH